MADSSGKKKVVRVDVAESKTEQGGRAWTPTAEAKSKASTARLIAWGSWILAIAIEVAVIIWVLPQSSERFWLLLVALIPIALFAILGNLQWKKANRLSPASKKNAFAFFVQNQLGAIMTVVAFLPLIIFILFDKNMNGKQKGIAAGIAAVAMIVIAVFTGTEWDGGPSQEQYAEEDNIMVQLTGEDRVYWVKGGSVFHVCAEVPDVNRESQDGTIYEGTVAEAHAFGKDRLTLRWESEALNHCGYTQDDVDAVNAGLTEAPSLMGDSDE